MSKFKVGDIVKGISDEYVITNDEMTKGKIVNIRKNGDIDIKVLEHNEKEYENCNTIYTYLNPKDFELIEEDSIKVGDIVEINKNATIEDFISDHWKGVKASTIRLLESNDFKKKFRVRKIYNEYVYTTIDEDKEYLLNKKIIQKVEYKEMTKEEIEKELGYKIKIKED